MSDEPRVNEEITAREVRLIDEGGANLGIKPIEEALALAAERNLDLVEVAPEANPPVCRIMDYGKYRYKQQKREREARKKQKVGTLKEMKMRPKIDQHDYDFKLKAIREFLSDGYKVRVTVFFRGREMSYLEMGKKLLEKVAEDCADLGRPEGTIQFEGKQYRLLLSPKGKN